MLVLTIVNNAGFLCFVIFGTLFILSIGMILTVNQKIDYTPQEFIYRDILRISHKYNYAEVKKIRYSKDVWIRVRHRTILIDSMCTEGHKFARIAMQYSSNAEIITNEKVKLWNGNIKNPGEFVFIYIFSAVALVIFCIWGMFSFKDIHINDFTIISGTITDCKFDKHEDGDDRLTISLSNKENTFYTWQIKENFLNSGHQDFSERYRQFFKLRFQNSKLTCKVVLHGVRHIFGSTLAAVNRTGQLVVIFLAGIDDRQHSRHILLSKNSRRRLHSCGQRKQFFACTGYLVADFFHCCSSLTNFYKGCTGVFGLTL